MAAAILSRPAPRIVPGDRAIVPVVTGTGPLRILLFGTSLSAFAQWPGDLSERLEACVGRKIEISRVAKAGADIRWALASEPRVVAARPDIILVEFAINDADMIDGLAPATARKLTTRLVTALRDDLPEARIVLMTMNPPSGWLRRLQRLNLTRHDRGYRAVAAEFSTGLVDLAPRWQTYPDLGAALPDGLHPTAAAERAVVLPALLAYLGQALGAACAMPTTGG